MEGKCVLDVADPHPIALDEHANHVEPVSVGGPAVAIDPDPRRAAQLPLFSPVHRFDRTAEPIAASSLDLDERHYAISLDHEIDVAMPGAEPALHHAPPALPKPSLRDPLPQLAECLPGR